MHNCYLKIECNEGWVNVEHQFYSELLGEAPSSFYVFLENGVAGRNAMLMEGISWVHQEIVLFNPVLVGHYKDLAVIEVKEPFIPIRSAVEIRDPPDAPVFSADSIKLMSSNVFTYEGVKFLDKGLKTYRYIESICCSISKNNSVFGSICISIF